MADQRIRLKDGVRLFPNWTLIIAHWSFAMTLVAASSLVPDIARGAQEEDALKRAALVLACPRLGPELSALRDREAQEIQANLLRSQAEARREEGRFIPSVPLQQPVDPGGATSPEGATDTQTPIFTWIPIPAAASYDVHIVRSDGWSLLETTQGMPFSFSRPLSFGWRYRWSYRGQNAEVGPGPWCNGGTFEITTSSAGTVVPGQDRLAEPGPPHRLAAPELLVPRGLLSLYEVRTPLSPTPTFRWRLVPRATRYLLVLETAEGAPIHESWVDVTSYVMPFGLEPGERFRWRVIPWNPPEGEGWPSPYVTFETPAPPLAAPNPVQPTAEAAENPPRFGWTSVRGATLYRLTVVRDKGARVLDAWSADATYIPQRPLPPGSTYRWSVRAWNAREGEGPESPQTDFDIPAVQPEKNNTGGDGENPPVRKTP